MSTHIQLLGNPRLQVGKERALNGHKPWGLLAYLLLEPGPISRREIAGLLCGEADDPAAAFRWALFQIRKSLSPALEIEDKDGALMVHRESDVVVDAERLLMGTLDVDEILAITDGELLAGHNFPSAPMFESWLSMQRSRVASAFADSSRWAATALINRDPDSAMRLVRRALVADPFNDGVHELAVAVHIARGDRGEASRYIEHVSALYRKELGVPPPATLSRPLERPVAPTGSPLVSLDIGARTLFETSEARFTAGDYEGAVSMARRAAAHAAASGDGQLEARALVRLARVLIHSVRGCDREAVGLLGRASELSIRLGDDKIASDTEREIGYVALLEARYGTAEASFGRAIAAAHRTGDEARRIRASVYRAICFSDRCDYRSAEQTLRGAVESLSTEASQKGLLSYTLATLARVYLRTQRFKEASETSREAVGEGRAAGAISILPWAMVWGAEADLKLGKSDEARTSYEEALALGVEIDDPCWEALALRGLALLDRQEGREDFAQKRLQDGVIRCRRLPDTYKWAEALLLTELAELGGADPEDVAAARAFAHQGPMPDLMSRLERKTASQTRSQTANP
ncbi:MAG: hypothetical protein GEU68_07435 [Actinobacteria bacterium]|nr:hypothetical protein [Actinomycetota bacterium]